MTRRNKRAAHFGRGYWLLRQLSEVLKRVAAALDKMARSARITTRQLWLLTKPAVTPKQIGTGRE